MVSAFAALQAVLHALTQPVRSRLASDDGIEAIEYALIAALIAVVVIAAVALLNPALGQAFSTIGSRVNDAANAINP